MTLSFAPGTTLLALVLVLKLLSHPKLLLAPRKIVNSLKANQSGCTPMLEAGEGRDAALIVRPPSILRVYVSVGCLSWLREADD